MPIVFVHGVAVRDPDSWENIEVFLRRFIAPTIASDAERVMILYAYWGDVGAQFAWHKESKPSSPLLGMGSASSLPTSEKALRLAELGDALDNLPAKANYSVTTGGLAPAGPSTVSSGATQSLRLKDLDAEQLSDLVVTLIQSYDGNAQQKTVAAIAADAVAHDATTLIQLAACADSQSELALLQALIEARYQVEQARATGLAGMGVASWLGDIGERLGEVVSRADDLPAYLLSRALVEARKPLNDFVTVFVGDVFAYLNNRGTSNNPGAIVQRILDALVAARENAKQRGNEPIIVLSHSMGGQIIYDVVSYFLPNMPQYADLRIDFWCATASQVGLFEELKLFQFKDHQYSKATGKKVPFPDQNLGGWWNVWDHNDFISYTSRTIFEGVDDESYDSGMSLLQAHSGYLQRPSFFRKFADKLSAAKANNWRTP